MTDKLKRVNGTNKVPLTGGNKMKRKIGFTFFAVFFTALFLFFTGNLNAAIPQAQRDALIALYNAANGDSWVNNSNWRKPGDPAQFNDPGTEHTWFGITLAPDLMNVEKIELTGNNLAGSLPADWSMLPQLNTLNLSSNQITGSIPDLTGLISLAVLDLSANSISGNLPSSLNTCTGLITLNLSENNIDGVIPEIGNLTSIEIIDLSFNTIGGGLPASLANLTSLKTLDLYDNGIYGNYSTYPVPDLSNLINLEYLDLGINNFGIDFPTWITNLTKLIYLDFSYNSFGGTIPDLSFLTQLQYLDLKSNLFSGSIPTWLNQVYNLKELDLSGNDYSGTVPDLSNLTQLTLLRMSSNNLTGTVPTWLNNLTNLQEVNFYMNQLTGTIPDLSSLTQLTIFDFGYNDLTGAIPGWLNNNLNLEILNFHDNDMTGTIPDLSNLSQLRELRLALNQLTGNFPTWIGSLTSLKYCYLEYNQLQGSLPSSIGSLTELAWFHATHNQLEGNIPPEIGNCTRMRYLFLGDNKLSGSIPPEIGNLTLMYELRLYGNQLVGSVPQELTNLTILFNNGLDFRWNGLYTDDSQLDTFIDLHHLGDWESTQTVAPEIYYTSAKSATSVKLYWYRIPYDEDDGGYRVYYSTTSGSGYQLAGVTTTKDTGSYTVIGLTPQTTYYFVVETFTNAHSDNQNAIVSGLSNEVSEFTEEPKTITVTSPDGMEKWYVDDTHTITWTSTGDISNVKIQYTPDDGYTAYTIVESTPNDGSYDWTLPNLPAEWCVVFVSDADGTASDHSDGYFSIMGYLTLMTPNCCVSLEGGYIYNITWDSKPGISDVKLEYTIDNGSSWDVIEASVPNTGSYGWTVPHTPSSQCRVKISNPADPSMEDVSDYTFSIIPQKTITVLTPNGGENWEVGDIHNITWSTSGAVGDVRIEYSSDGGSNWNLIEAYANFGSYAWTVPGPVSSNCLVRIKDADGPAIDTSNGVFTIFIPTIPTAERDALIALYNSTNGDNWNSNTNWRKPGDPTQFNDPGTESTWYGVTCNTAGTQVERIDLTTNNLVGTIPDLSALTGMWQLKLRRNHLTGDIPVELTNLTALTELDLSLNSLSGNIPDLDALANLTTLKLEGNTLTGSLPLTLLNLTSLLDDNLDLRWNALYSDNTDLINFLNSKQDGGDWESTQTIAPADLAVGDVTIDSVNVSWTPILYQGDVGGYRVYYSTTSGSGYILAGTTADKTESNYTVTGLDPATTFYFVVESFTYNHIDNQNTVVSEYSTEVSTTTEAIIITVTSPNGSETWEGGSNQNITWTNTGSIPNVKIEYSTDNGSNWITITAATANSGLYNWSVPNTPSAACLIKISDTAGPASDTSDSVFSITEQRTLTVVSPNGGESWEGGFIQPIAWNSSGNITDVKIEYSTDSGASYNTVIASTPNSGNYDWTIPNTPSSNCLIKITDTGGLALDTSDGVFTIAEQRTLTVTSPDGSESWEGGFIQPITWNSTGAIANVTIEYSTDSGSSWNTIAASAANSGTYNWTVTNTPSTTCLIRISDIAGPASDTSNAVFTIIPMRTITVTSPNSTVEWFTGSNQVITWTTTGAVGNVAIDYSTDNGSTWSPVAASTANSGSYDWIVPDTPSSDCLVKVGDTTSTVFDTGDVPFTISPPRIPDTQRAALIAIYNSTNGDSWTNNANWRKPGEPTEFNDPGTENTWFGVTCDAGNILVEKIEVANNNLTGTISDLSDLTELQILDLNTNSLSGSIPASLNTLINLTTLDLNMNQLTGTMPDLSGLIQLTKLDLSTNNLTGTIPTYLNSLTNLTYLGLSSNALTGAIPDLNSLSQLQQLYLAECQLSGSIPDLSSLTQLQVFDLGSNQLTGTIPTYLNSLTNLVNLELGSNQLTGTIPDFSSLSQLQTLDISNNQLTGTIPASIGSLTALQYLYLNDNQFDGAVPTALGDLSLLQALSLKSNKLTGSIPLALSNLTALLDNGSDIGWNGLHTGDTGLRDFLNLKQVGGDWESTQTIAPAGLSAGEETQNSIKVLWTPISYQGDSGGYRVYYSTTSGSGYTLAGTTVDKSIDNYTVSGLNPATTYYFVVESFTDSHGNNGNSVVSEYSEEISAATYDAPTLTVTMPNGGQSWEAFTTQAITWNSTGNITDVKIEYSTDSGSNWNTIIASTANSGSYNWAVANTPSTNSLIKITDIGGLADDTSDGVFTIAEQRTLTVVSPNGSESWEGGFIQPVTWNSTGAIANVLIEYSTDNGNNWNTIIAAAANSGTYNWTVPNTPSTTCLIRVSDTAGTASDTGNAVFSILEQRTITVITPNGTEDWLEDSIHDITWSTTGLVANVAIDYSTDGGSFWIPVVSSTTNTGTYSWTIPATPSTTCLIRVSDTAGPAADESNGFFTITGLPPILFETGVLTGVGNSWQTVTLQYNYTSMVVVCSNDLGDTGLPAVCRVRNASGTSFEVMVQNPNGSGLSGYNVYYTVVEEGVYNAIDHGVKMEAVKVTAAATARAGSWTMESRSYNNSYNSPVVLGQVMTYNDAKWSVFWASADSNRSTPPTSGDLSAGKHVGEDTDNTRANEIIGYIVFETGSGSINGIPYTAAVGSDSVKGPDNTSTGYTYNFSGVPTPTTAIISVAAMDGGNGGWPVFYGSSPLTATTLILVFDEDQVKDSERSHTSEQIAYAVFGGQ